MLKTGINVKDFGYPISIPEQVKIIKDVGFDALFTGLGRSVEELDLIANEAAKVGLETESLHAPWAGIGAVWLEGEKGEQWVTKLKNGLDICKKFGFGYMTVHCMNVPRFNNNGPVGSRFSELGAKRFAEVVSYAADIGLITSFENVEFPQLELKSLVEYCREQGLTKGLGITYDVGHWNCYPSGLDFADTFGDLTVGTHVHDNYGNKNPQVITWDDDNHILPFDGTINWMEVGDTLRRSSYKGTIALELGRNQMLPWYADYPTAESYLTVAHERACHVAKLCE